ncbi:Uncharacterised protein [Vibrio cholerae]|nr:Uncharacterised protein [Vibrio cholerae]
MRPYSGYSPKPSWYSIGSTQTASPLIHPVSDSPTRYWF